MKDYLKVVSALHTSIVHNDNKKWIQNEHSTLCESIGRSCKYYECVTNIPKICSKSRGERTSRPTIEEENPKKKGEEDIINA